MKSTGMTRKVDELGRVGIPIELRKTLGIEIKDPIEVFIDNDRIVLQRFHLENTCMITGEISDNNVTLADGNIVLSPKGIRLLIDELEQYL